MAYEFNYSEFIMSTLLSPRRSLLFTPANRPALFAKALLSGADMVCVDLEDAVAADQKASSRTEAFAFLAAGNTGFPERSVRINSPQTDAGQADLQALRQSGLQQGTLLVPKVESAEEVTRLIADLAQISMNLRLAVLIESAIGIENIYTIVKAAPRLDFVMFGGVDLAAELGTRVAPEPLAYARSRLVYAARHAKIDVLDMPCLDFRNAEVVRQDAELARLLGFNGKAVIHPANVATINTAFTPTDAELDEARRIVDAYQNSTTGVAVVDGKVVEKPVVMAMELVLASGLAAKPGS